MSNFAEAFWRTGPQCPYCGSQRVTKYKQGQRYQCYSCFTAFSATTKTIAHHTHLDLAIWRLAAIEIGKNPKVSNRGLAKILGVSVKTAKRLKLKLETQDIAIRKQVNAILIAGG